MVVEQTARGERSYDIYSRLLKERVIFLRRRGQRPGRQRPCRADAVPGIGEPGQGHQPLHQLARVASVTAGLAIYDTMQFIKPDVSTMCIGQAASMGSLLLAAGAKGKRLCAAEFAHHDPPAVGRAAFRAGHRHRDPGPRDPAHARAAQRDLCASIPASRSRRSSRDTERDRFMSAADAKAYGLIDEVLDKALERSVKSA